MRLSRVALGLPGSKGARVFFILSRVEVVVHEAVGRIADVTLPHPLCGSLPRRQLHAQQHATCLINGMQMTQQQTNARHSPNQGQESLQ